MKIPVIIAIITSTNTKLFLLIYFIIYSVFYLEQNLLQALFDLYLLLSIIVDRDVIYFRKSNA